MNKEDLIKLLEQNTKDSLSLVHKYIIENLKGENKKIETRIKYRPNIFDDYQLANVDNCDIEENGIMITTDEGDQFELMEENFVHHDWIPKIMKEILGLNNPSLEQVERISKDNESLSEEQKKLIQGSCYGLCDDVMILKVKKEVTFENLPSTIECWDDGIPVTKQLFRDPDIGDLRLVPGDILLLGIWYSDEEDGVYTYYLKDLSNTKSKRWYSTCTIEDEVISPNEPQSKEARERAERIDKFMDDNKIKFGR